MNIAAIIPAAGAGRRMGGVRKAFLPVAGKPMLQHSIDVFRAHTGITQIVVVLAADDMAAAPEWLRDSRVTLAEGGAERADSVRNALHVLDDNVDAVLIHDAARPLISADLIDRLIIELNEGRCGTVAIPVTDTLHEADERLDIRYTPDRSRYWRAQTPQAFPRAILEQAFALSTSASAATDEAGLVAAAGWPVRIVAGDPRNIKVTTADDVTFVEAALRERAT